MRAVLNALTDELQRLKTAGVKTVAVSDESVAALRRVIAARSTGTRKTSPPSAAVAAKPYEPPPSPIRATVAAVPYQSAPIPAPPTVTLPAGDKQTRWNALLSLVQNDTVCRAHAKPGKKIVLGVGALDAKIFFCGEAPGAEEEIQGEPFVGPAGQLLTKMIQAMGLQRSEVYIGNIMNWRPEMPTAFGNRPPTPDEMAYCLPYLRAQLAVVEPALIVALGATAAKGLLGADRVPSLGAIRGRWYEFAGKPVMVTYHPSYLLHNDSLRSKRAVWEDLLKVMERAALPISEKQRGFFLPK